MSCIVKYKGNINSNVSLLLSTCLFNLNIMYGYNYNLYSNPVRAPL